MGRVGLASEMARLDSGWASLAVSGLSAKDSMEGPVKWPSRVIDGERMDALPSALKTAPFAISPFELLKIEDSLFLTCFNGLSP
jgi:hypothetical protein